MEIGTKPEKIRIVSGRPQEVECQLNLLLGEYSTLMWSWAAVKDEIVVSVVLIHNSEVRKAQMMAGLSNGRN